MRMKRKTAKEILAESFQELASQKKVDKITVIDIAENCGYSTTTFYRHFTDKYDLMAWAYTQRLEEIISGFDRDMQGWKQTWLDAALFYDEQKEYLKNLLLHTSGFDSFVRNMKRIHYESLRKKILNTADESEFDVKMEMYVRAYCQGTVDLTCDWIMGQYDAGPEELAEVYENLLPYPLKAYLLSE